MNPLDYSLCDQTVTFYRKSGEKIQRKVADNCHLSCKYRTATESYGKSMEKKFLLIIPGNTEVRTGDRIYAGTGPKDVDWQSFVPANVPGLSVLQWVKTYYWENEPCHTEAGC